MKKLAATLILTTAISTSAMAESETAQYVEGSKDKLAYILIAENKEPLYNSETKEEISTEAQQLIEDLKSTLKHTGKLTKKIATPIIEKMSTWIKDNYDGLTPESKQKIKDFVAKTKENYTSSVAFFKKLIDDFVNTIKEIHEENRKTPKSQKNEGKKLYA